MRIAVVGCGSIGLRHLRNLKVLGESDLIAFDPSADARCKAVTEIGIQPVDNLTDLWASHPDIAFITSPTSFHLEHTFEAVRANCHVFVEKPLSHEAAGLFDLRAEVESRGLVSMVGCNMRFHPGPAAVKDLLDRGSIEPVIAARVYAGSYLPEWRPSQDYRRSYSANIAMGGGCILDYIHELDLARWYLGEVEEVTCVAGHLSSLEMDVEDTALLICRHRSSALSEIHLSYFRRPAGRGCEIYGENGTIIWRLEEAKVRYFCSREQHWHDHEQSANWELNQMYLDEIRHFLERVRVGHPTVCPIDEAIQVMRIALAAKKSSKSGCRVRTSEVFE